MFPDETTAPSSPGVPHSREAEEASIGAVLINPEAFYQVKQHIANADDFYIHRMRWVWQAYEALKERGTDIDLLTVSDELVRKGRLDEVGGSSFLTSLINQVPSSLNAANYAKIVHEDSVRRKMIEAANKIASLAYNGEEQLPEILSACTNALSEAISHGTRTKSLSLNEALIVLDAKLDERKRSGIQPGLPTGLIDLDKKLGGGAQNGDLILISARPGQGKTSLLLQLARHAAKHNRNGVVVKKRVVFFSLEMSQEQLIMRLIAQISGMDYQQIQAGKYDEAKYIAALDEIASMDIVIDDTPAMRPSQIKARLKILDTEAKVDAVFVDSLNLMVSDVDYKNRTDLAMDQKATDLKNIAREMDIPFWVAHQMNRRIEGRSDDAKPQLSDLAEGGEKPADIVIFIWHKWDEVKTDEIERSELCVEKHRNGPTGDVTVVFRQALTLFESAYVSKFPNRG